MNDTGAVITLKNEVQNLCDELTKYGEEYLILTVNLSNNGSAYFGSVVGQEFIQTKLEIIKQFYHYCQGRYLALRQTNEIQQSGNTTENSNTVTEDQTKEKIAHSSKKEPIQSEETSTNQNQDEINCFNISRQPMQLEVSSTNQNQGEISNTSVGSDITGYSKFHMLNNLDKTKDVENGDQMVKRKNDNSRNKSDKRKDIESAESFDIFVGQNVLGKLVKQVEDNEAMNQDDFKEVEYNVTKNPDNFKKGESNVTRKGYNFKARKGNVTKTKDYCNKGVKKAIKAATETEEESETSKKITKLFRLKTISSLKSKKSSTVTKTKNSTLRKRDNRSSIMKNVDKALDRKKITSRKLYTCTFCDKVYLTASRLTLHIRKTHENLMTKHTCNVCNESFSKPKGLSRHRVNQSHAQPCEICGKEFIHTPEFKKHMRYHRAEKRKLEKVPNKCEFCQKEFWGKGDLNKHRRVHTKEKPYMCDVCGSQFALPSQLSCHRRIHTGERPYTCTDCGKKFTLSNTLARHRRKHSGEKYQCHLCGKQYASRWNLTVHVDYIHTGITPFKCEFCGKEFNRKDNLKVHKKKHEKEIEKANASNFGNSNVSANMFITELVESAVEGIGDVDLLPKSDGQYYTY